MVPLPLAALAEHFGQTIINVLAVAGSAAVGYFLTLGIVWLACKLTIHRPPPRTVAKIISLLGGILCGLLMALLLFKGEGGGGFGLGGGLGLGRGPNSTTSATTNSTEPERTEKTETSDNPKSAQLFVFAVGGRQEEQKFYRLETGPTLDLAGIEDVIRARMKRDDLPKLKEVVIVLEKHTLVPSHHAITNLQDFAKSQNLIPTIQDRTAK